MAIQSRHINWGIMGTGWIANDFASALSTMPDVCIHAVGSRSRDKAESFAEKYAIKNRYSSYLELVSDPQIDIVHIATPHPLHKEHALMALQHGKAVLCEKPFTMNATQAKEVIDYAKSNKLFLMEAMWGRFTPGQTKLRELLADNVIGEVLSFSANFGSNKEFIADNRFFNPEHGGGTLLDIGIYPISLMFMVLGMPDDIRSLGHIGSTGVDESFTASFYYRSGQTASVTATNRTRTPREAMIMGSEGFIKVHSPHTFPPKVTLHRHDAEEAEEFDTTYNGWGFVFEAAEAMRCIRNGLTESPLLPLEETLAVVQIMDTMRNAWGLKYPNELS